jgi:hypothetical protein
VTGVGYLVLEIFRLLWEIGDSLYCEAMVSANPDNVRVLLIGVILPNFHAHYNASEVIFRGIMPHAT